MVLVCRKGVGVSRGCWCVARVLLCCEGVGVS